MGGGGEKKASLFSRLKKQKVRGIYIHLFGATKKSYIPRVSVLSHHHDPTITSLQKEITFTYRFFY